MDLKPVVAKLDVLATNLAAAKTIRDRVRISDRIFETLAEVERQVESFVVTEIGQSNSHRPVASTRDAEEQRSAGRFGGQSLTRAAAILLREHGVLHGKEIERRLKEGGYASSAKKFQTTMRVAFKRHGGFENIGGNRWKLREMTRHNA